MEVSERNLEQYLAVGRHDDWQTPEDASERPLAQELYCWWERLFQALLHLQALQIESEGLQGEDDSIGPA